MYHPANHKIPVYSNKMRKFDMWTLPWQALWQLPLHIITAQAVAVGCVWCSWWQFSTFRCKIASRWIIWLRGYCDMDRIDIGIEMWHQYWYRYRKICNDMQPYWPGHWSERDRLHFNIKVRHRDPHYKDKMVMRPLKWESLHWRDGIFILRWHSEIE